MHTLKCIGPVLASRIEIRRQHNSLSELIIHGSLCVGICELPAWLVDRRVICLFAFVWVCGSRHAGTHGCSVMCECGGDKPEEAEEKHSLGGLREG